MKNKLYNNNIMTNIDLLSLKCKLDDNDLSEAMHISIATFRRRKKNPNTFTLNEIELVAKKLHTTPERLLGNTEDIFLSENQVTSMKRNVGR